MKICELKLEIIIVSYGTNDRIVSRRSNTKNKMQFYVVMWREMIQNAIKIVGHI
jgi:hypothetical protein